MLKSTNLRKAVLLGTVFAFFSNGILLPPAHAQELSLPAPGTRVSLSPPVNPPLLKGLKVHPNNPLRFEFILDKGDPVKSAQTADYGAGLKAESTKLIKYFLASLTTPEKDLWVNLSPYEKDRIVPDAFGQTEMGRDLLAQDYLLKQITASLIYPEEEIGQKFWQRVYQEAAEKFGTTQVPVNTFNKVWIMPEKAVVYENAKAGTAYVVESKLKVMLEEDYLAVEKNGCRPGDTFRRKCPQAGCQANEGLNAKAPQGNPRSTLAQDIIREIVIPQLTKEINEGKNFTQLRQVYNSLILATWYKKKIKDSILSQVYADKNKVAGLVSLRGDESPEAIYKKYLEAFKKGAYNYIKEQTDPATQQPIPRKYFSGGFTGDMNVLTFQSEFTDMAQLSSGDRLVRVSADFAMNGTANTTQDDAQILRNFNRGEPLRDFLVWRHAQNTEFLNMLHRLDLKIEPQKIRSIVGEVVNNAFDAVDDRRRQEPAGYRGRVAYSFNLTTQGNITVQVEDNGAGIGLENLRRYMEERFGTSKGIGQIGRYGLGIIQSREYLAETGLLYTITVDTKDAVGARKKVIDSQAVAAQYPRSRKSGRGTWVTIEIKGVVKEGAAAQDIRIPRQTWQWPQSVASMEEFVVQTAATYPEFQKNISVLGLTLLNQWGPRIGVLLNAADPNVRFEGFLYTVRMWQDVELARPSSQQNFSTAINKETNQNLLERLWQQPLPEYFRDAVQRRLTALKGQGTLAQRFKARLAGSKGLSDAIKDLNVEYKYVDAQLLVNVQADFGDQSKGDLEFAIDKDLNIKNFDIKFPDSFMEEHGRQFMFLFLLWVRDFLREDFTEKEPVHFSGYEAQKGPVTREFYNVIARVAAGGDAELVRGFVLEFPLTDWEAIRLAAREDRALLAEERDPAGWDLDKVTVQRMDRSFFEWTARDGGMDPLDLQILKQILTGDKTILEELLHSYKGKVAVKNEDDAQGENGRAVYLELSRPFASQAGNITILRLKGARVEPSEEAQVPSHIGRGRDDFPLAVNEMGNLMPGEAARNPQGGTKSFDREYEQMQAGQEGLGFETDYPIASGIWKGRLFQDQPVGFVIAGMRTRDVRISQAIFHEEFLKDIITGERKVTTIEQAREIFQKLGRSLRAYHNAGYFHRYPHTMNLGVETAEGQEDRIILRDLDTTKRRSEMTGTTDMLKNRQEAVYRLLDIQRLISRISVDGLGYTDEGRIKGSLEPLIEAFWTGYLGQDIKTSIRDRLIAASASEQFITLPEVVYAKKTLFMNENVQTFGVVWKGLYDLVANRPADAAAVAREDRQKTGGIDLTSDTFVSSGNGFGDIKFTVDRAMMQQLHNAQGLTPVILDVQPMTDLALFLGLNAPQAR